jgi:hypothetical protein
MLSVSILRETAARQQQVNEVGWRTYWTTQELVIETCQAVPYVTHGQQD